MIESWSCGLRVLEDEPEAVGRGRAVGERVVHQLEDLAPVRDLRVGGQGLAARTASGTSAPSRRSDGWRFGPSESLTSGMIANVATGVEPRSAKLRRNDHQVVRVRATALSLSSCSTWVIFRKTLRLGWAGPRTARGGYAESREPTDLSPMWPCSLTWAPAEGDRTSWEALVDRFASMVLAVARKCGLSAADAADVSQTTWMRVGPTSRRYRAARARGRLARDHRPPRVAESAANVGAPDPDGPRRDHQSRCAAFRGRLESPARRAQRRALRDLHRPAAPLSVDPGFAGGRRRDELRGLGQIARHANRQHRPDAREMPRTFASTRFWIGSQHLRRRT